MSDEFSYEDGSIHGHHHANPHYLKQIFILEREIEKTVIAKQNQGHGRPDLLRKRFIKIRNAALAAGVNRNRIMAAARNGKAAAHSSIHGEANPKEMKALGAYLQKLGPTGKASLQETNKITPSFQAMDQDAINQFNKSAAPERQAMVYFLSGGDLKVNVTIDPKAGTITDNTKAQSHGFWNWLKGLFH